VTRILATLPILIAPIVGGFFLWGLNPDRDPNEIPSVLISQPVSGFDLAPVAGVNVPGLARADLTGNPEPVVNVFASWCVPCRAEHAVLTRIVERDGVRLMGINYEDKPEDALAWLDELGNPYERNGSDLNGRAGIEWGISGVPETFIISGAGTVLYRYVGPVVGPEAEAEFATALEQARATGASAHDTQNAVRNLNTCRPAFRGSGGRTGRNAGRSGAGGASAGDIERSALRGLPESGY
jgi:cytochrome c biogenesis protein CcmG/thiol:disulfide interchange protein DsbE